MGKEFKKFAYIPVVIVAGAFSWFKGLIKKNPNADITNMIADNWGWTGAGMDPHWDRLFNPPADSKWYENVKNIGSEYARLDSERIYKLSAFNYLEISIVSGAIGFLIAWIF